MNFTEWMMTAAASCGADAWEPNDERALSGPPLATLRDARMCGEDEDWYAIELKRGVAVEIAVLHDLGEFAFAPEVFAPRSRRPVGRAYEAPGETGTRVVPSVSGTYRVRVHSRLSAEAFDYVLGVFPCEPTLR